MLCLFVCVQMSAEGGRGLDPWNWNYRSLWVAWLGCWEWNLSSLQRAASVLKDWAITPVPAKNASKLVFLNKHLENKKWKRAFLVKYF